MKDVALRPRLNGFALCAGIGGLELGIKLVCPSYTTVCYVEREAYNVACLVKRMEEGWLDKAPIWDDVATFDGLPWRGVVDIVTAGFPCQPVSAAGKKLVEKDERWLWPDITRIIREVGPRLVFLENVPGLLVRGFGRVLGDLAELGFDARWGVFSAAEVGAPHIRRRVFILAWCERNAIRQLPERVAGSTRPPVSRNALPRNIGEEMADTENDNWGSGDSEEKARTRSSRLGRRGSPGRDKEMGDSAGTRCGTGQSGSSESIWNKTRRKESHRRCDEVADCNGGRCEGRRIEEYPQLESEPRSQSHRCRDNGFFQWPPGPSGDWEGIPDDLKPAIRRVAHGFSNRLDRLRALGNAVVPIVAAKAFTELMKQI